MESNLKPDWLRRYQEEYLTLEEVAEMEGITREGIRQRLLQRGIKPRNLKETQMLREIRETDRAASGIRETFLRTRDIEVTAEAVGLPPLWVRRFVQREIPDSRVLEQGPRTGSNRYSRDDLVISLKDAASGQAVNLTSTAYEAFAHAKPMLEDGRTRPGKQAMMLRYGSWRGALAAAGLPSNPHSGPGKDFEPEDAISAVVEAWRAMGSPPTGVRYDEWQRGYSGRPSAATVRKLFPSWNGVLVSAWQIVHGIVLDQDNPDLAVPEPLLTDSSEQRGPLFGPYVSAAEGMAISLGSEMIVSEYTSLERAVQSHARIQNEVARVARFLGFSVWSPTLEGPAFDIALRDKHDVTTVVEVKSATPENLEFQLRIGLGQVLRYAHRLRAEGTVVVPAIAIELRPDDSWVALLSELGVSLLVDGTIAGDLERAAAASRS